MAALAPAASVGDEHAGGVCGRRRPLGKREARRLGGRGRFDLRAARSQGVGRMSAGLEVKHGETGHRGSFYIERDGDRVAEQTYSMLPGGKIVIIDHTEVAESLRGQD